MLIIIALSILWMIYASVDGFIQAHYYDLYPSEKGHKNIHLYYVIQRCVLISIMYYIINIEYDWILAFIFIVSLIFMFSFWHNGFYYKTRNKLNNEIYKKKFWYDSDTSTATINIPVNFRCGMLIIGIAFIIGLFAEIKYQPTPTVQPTIRSKFEIKHN